MAVGCLLGVVMWAVLILLVIPAGPLAVVAVCVAVLVVAFLLRAADSDWPVY